MGTDEMTFNAPFEIPFVIGVSVMFAVIAYKYLRWFIRMPSSDRRKVWKGIFTRSSVGAVGETVRESLLHRRIFKVNPLLGYMHTSLAFGWFLLIAVGWIETIAYLGFVFVPLHGHVFFKYFSTGMDHTSTMSLVFSNLMDLLLLVVLSGVALAWFKRMRSRAMGMKRTTRHTVGDRIALSALWIVFPARLVAESFTAGIYNNGGFLTGSIGKGLLHLLGENTLYDLQPYVWLIYSLALGIFFTAMPFSRYMHIFTEVPLIFLRRWGVRSSEKEQSYDHFQVEACSRCGICIDPCQLQSMSRYNDVQSVYFLRDRRYHRLREQTAMNCLMCGRCEVRCPVGIELNTLRLNSRDKMRNTPNEKRYEYLKGCDPSSGEGHVGYFAGCMTLLTPRILLSMQRIFEAAGEQVWWADKDGGVCCGRPLKLSGETDSARRMMEFNKSLFEKHGITTLVTSCPICLRVFKEDYGLKGIEVLHHSEYISRLISTGRLTLKHTDEKVTYHDPCELGRGSGIYDAPRDVISAVANLVEPDQTRENALCCGSSVANAVIDDPAQVGIAEAVDAELEATGAERIVTACPLCKKALGRGTQLPVVDLAEVVAGAVAESRN